MDSSAKPLAAEFQPKGIAPHVLAERDRRETELRCRRLAREADRLVAEDAER